VDDLAAEKSIDPEKMPQSWWLRCGARGENVIGV